MMEEIKEMSEAMKQMAEKMDKMVNLLVEIEKNIRTLNVRITEIF